MPLIIFPAITSTYSNAFPVALLVHMDLSAHVCPAVMCDLRRIMLGCHSLGITLEGRREKEGEEEGEEEEERRGAKCYVALRQVAASQRVLKVRRMSSQPLRLLLCCFTSTEKSNKNDKCVG